MIEPYNAAGLVPTYWGIREEGHRKQPPTPGGPDEYRAVGRLDIPVRLLVIPEARCKGSTTRLDVDHADFARTCHRHPGPETDWLGRTSPTACSSDAQAKARHEDWPHRFFNVGLVHRPGWAPPSSSTKLTCSCRASVPCRHTTYSTGGSRSTVGRSTPSGRSPTRRSDALGS